MFDVLVKIADPPIAAFPEIPIPPWTITPPCPINVGFTVEVNVLAPAKDCTNVETKPVAAVPAIGILKVWSDPEETILGNAPVYPIKKFCTEAVRSLSLVIPEPLETKAQRCPSQFQVLPTNEYVVCILGSGKLRSAISHSTSVDVIYFLIMTLVNLVTKCIFF